MLYLAYRWWHAGKCLNTSLKKMKNLSCSICLSISVVYIFPITAGCKLWTRSQRRQKEAEYRKGGHNQLLWPIPASSLGLRVFEKIQINCQLLKTRRPSQNVDFWFLLEKWKLWPCGAHIPLSQPLIEELWLLPLQSPLVPWSYPPSWVSPATHHCGWRLSCPLVSLLRFLFSLWDIRTKESHPLAFHEKK